MAWALDLIACSWIWTCQVTLILYGGGLEAGHLSAVYDGWNNNRSHSRGVSRTPAGHTVLMAGVQEEVHHTGVLVDGWNTPGQSVHCDHGCWNWNWNTWGAHRGILWMEHQVSWGSHSQCMAGTQDLMMYVSGELLGLTVSGITLWPWLEHDIISSWCTMAGTPQGTRYSLPTSYTRRKRKKKMNTRRHLVKSYTMEIFRN